MIATTIEQGLIYAIMALGVYITYKILDVPDLSVDGTFPLGAALTALYISKGVNPYIVLVLTFLVGAIAGVITGIIHVKLKVRDLLAGIIVMTGLYSINLRIAGRANVAFYNQDTIFTLFPLNKILPEQLVEYERVILLAIIVIILKLLLDLYLKTKSGYLLRATGSNKTLITSLGKDSGLVKIVGLGLANGFASLAGGICAQQQKFFDISMGTGTVVIGLASVIIGISVFKYITFMKHTTSVVIGSILYKACISLAIAKITIKASASDLNLITAILFLIILVITKDKKRRVRQNG